MKPYIQCDEALYSPGKELNYYQCGFPKYKPALPLQAYGPPPLPYPGGHPSHFLHPPHLSPFPSLLSPSLPSPPIPPSPPLPPSLHFPSSPPPLLSHSLSFPIWVLTSHHSYSDCRSDSRKPWKPIWGLCIHVHTAMVLQLFRHLTSYSTNSTGQYPW